MPTFPPFQILKEVYQDAFSIALVSYALSKITNLFYFTPFRYYTRLMFYAIII